MRRTIRKCIGKFEDLEKRTFRLPHQLTYKYLPNQSTPVEKPKIELPAEIQEALEAREGLAELFGSKYRELKSRVPQVLYTREELAKVGDQADSIRKHLDMEHGQLKNLIKLHSFILSRGSNEGSMPTIEYWESRLGLSNAQIRKIITKMPRLVICKKDEIEEILSYLEKRLQWKGEQLKKSIVKCPAILSLTKDNLETQISYLEERLQWNAEQLGKIIIKLPDILTMSKDEVLEPRITWLQKRLDLTDEKLSDIISKTPNLLLYSVSENFEPKVNWLQKRLELSNDQTSHVVRRMPSILTKSIEEQMEPILQFLERRLLLSEKENTTSELASVIVQMPPLLASCAETNLEPTLDFFIDAMDGDETQVVEIIKKDPRFLGSSLEKRLKPRLAEIREAGMVVDYALLYAITCHKEQRWIDRIRNRINNSAEEESIEETEEESSKLENNAEEETSHSP